MQSDRGQFITNLANGCRKDMLVFASLIVYLLYLASHNANQFLSLLFQRKRTADIYALIIHVIS